MVCRLETLVGRHGSFKLYSLLGEYLTRLGNKQAAAEYYFLATMRYHCRHHAAAVGITS